MDRYFSVGVSKAKVYGDAQKSTLVAVADVLRTSTIDISTGSTEIRGGQRNPLLYTYFHTPDVTVTLTNTAWNMSLMAKNSGGTLGTTAVVPYEEEITLVLKVGTVSKTPVGSEGGAAYCWYNYNGVAYRATFSGSTFTVDSSIPDNSVVCVSYSYTNNAVTNLTVPANYIPATLYIEMENALATNNAGSGVVGRNIYVIPSAQLSGAQTIEMTSDGYTETELTMKALAYKPYGSTCGNSDIFCYIIQEITNANWYDNVVELAVTGGDDDIDVGSTAQLTVYAIREGLDGSFIVPDYSDLTFASGTTGVATVSASGVVTGVSAGTAVITATITAKSAVHDSQTVTIVTP